MALRQVQLRGEEMAYAKGNIDSTDTVYMLMTDRFFDGNPANNGKLGEEYRPGDLHFYQGGDWEGIRQKLEYIKELGFSAVWISAPQDNEQYSRTGDEAGYHGYYTRDFNSPNPHFGTEEELRALIERAEELGLKIIIDVQLNHTADYLEYPSLKYDPPEYRPAAPFDNPEWYHHTPNIVNFDDPYEAQNYSLGGLDDLAQENPACWKALLDAYWEPDRGSGWFSYGFCGSRIDAVMEIPPEYLARFEKHTGKHCFGEAFTGSVKENAAFQNYLWGMLDYPLYFQMNRTFCSGEDWSGIKWVFGQDGLYKNPNRLFTFLDNHDRARFLANCSDNISRLWLALAFLYSARGIPVLYYGTEQHMAGDFRYTEQTINDCNREMMTGFSTESGTFALIQRLNWVRRRYKKALVYGEQKELYYQDGDPVYAFVRGDPAQDTAVFCLFNCSAAEQKRQIQAERERGMLTNLLETRQSFPLYGGGLEITIPGNGAMLLALDHPLPFIPKKGVKTKIIIFCDVGYGNAVYIRGDTKPLSWEFGQKCENIDADTWIFETERAVGGKITFKLLFNDCVWEQGVDRTVSVGEKIEVYPHFFT